jgi:sugar phosphate isomerase/epimerase
MCRALKVLCVASDAEALAALKRAAVSAEWELAPGATTETDALRQLHEERPHLVVAFGDFGHLVAEARAAFPSLRIVADRDRPGATAVATSLDEVRGALKELPRPGGPVL